MKYLTILLTFCGLIAMQATFAQVTGKQNLNVYGNLYDTKGNPVYDTALSIVLFFNKQKLAETRPNTEGNYAFTASAYGNIRQVDINVYLEGELLCEQKDIVLKNGSREINLPIPQKDNWYISSVKNWDWDRGAFEYYWWSRNSIYRSPYGTFAYYKPYSFDPMIYHNKISQYITVYDKKGCPVANALIKITVHDDADPRWGLTDENGQLQLHMQFTRGARQGTFHIQAEGYRSKKLPLQNMNTVNHRSYRLTTLN